MWNREGFMGTEVLKCQWWCWCWGETILFAERMEFVESQLICPSCWLGDSMMPALQEVLMKELVGHAGMWSGCALDLGASFLNFSIWKRDRESAISLHTPETWVTQTLISPLLAQKYNKRTKPMVCGARVEPLSQISTTARLSKWNRIFWRA